MEKLWLARRALAGYELQSSECWLATGTGRVTVNLLTKIAAIGTVEFGVRNTCKSKIDKSFDLSERTLSTSLKIKAKSVNCLLHPRSNHKGSVLVDFNKDIVVKQVMVFVDLVVTNST